MFYVNLKPHRGGDITSNLYRKKFSEVCIKVYRTTIIMNKTDISGETGRTMNARGISRFSDLIVSFSVYNYKFIVYSS